MPTLIANGEVYTPLQSEFEPRGRFAQDFASRLRSYGNEIAFIEDDLINPSRRFSFSDAAELSENFAKGLQSLGFREEDKLCLYCGTVPDFFWVFMGTQLAGGTVVQVPPHSDADLLKFFIDDSNATFIVFSKEFQQNIDIYKSSMTSGEMQFIRIEDGESMCVPELILKGKGRTLNQLSYKSPENTISSISYTSGTTGKPKGCLFDDRMLHYMCYVAMDAEQGLLPSNSTMLLTTPPTHVSGILLTMYCLSSRSCVVTLKARSIELIMNLISKYKISCLPLFSNIATAIIDSPLAKVTDMNSVKVYTSSGSYTPIPTRAKVQQAFNLDSIKQGYFMTEACISFTDNGDVSFSHSGRPLPGMRVRVCSLEDGRPLTIKEEGEFRLKGPSVTSGYLNRSQATKEAFDESGWFKTGDVGYYDAAGNLFLTGRVKEMIKCMNGLVAPTEVEDLLRTHPEVTAALVTGVPHKEFGEAARAYIVPKNGSQVSEEDIHKFVESKLPLQARLHAGVEFIKAIKTSHIGKPQRKDYRDEYIKANAAKQ